LEMKTGFEDQKNESRNEREEEEFTTVTFEDDEDFGDDDSWTSASQMSTTSQMSNTSKIHEPPLAKIDESNEMAARTDRRNVMAKQQGTSTGDIISTAFADMFTTISTKDAQNSTADAMAESKSKSSSESTAVEVSPPSSSYSSKFGFFGARKQSSPDKLKQSTSSDSTSTIGSKDPTSPSKQDKQSQIEGLKQTHHFMERSDKAGKLARFYSRSSLAGSSLVSAAAVTVMAGAALSVVHVAFEANNLAATIKRIQAGSPSKRATVLRMIKDDIKNLPSTQVLVDEWDKYFEVLVERQKADATMDGNSGVTGVHTHVPPEDHAGLEGIQEF